MAEGTPEILKSSQLLPRTGVPIHINRPVHEGDIPLHQHDFVEIAMVISGKGLVRSIGGVNTAHRGDTFVLHPGQWHAYERCHGLHIFNCCFGAQLLQDELSWVVGDPLLGPLVSGRTGRQEIISFNVNEAGVLTCLGIIDRIKAIQTGDPLATRADTLGHLLLMLGELARQRGKAPGQTSAAESAHPAVIRAMELLEQDLCRDWSLEDLSTRLQLNRSHLIRLFRRRTGLTPMLWLARRRGEQAAVMLLTGTKPVAQIGREVGWNDANYFARRFRSLFGLSPREYREQLPCPAAPLHAPQDWLQW